jgi:hypothetical protein
MITLQIPFFGRSSDMKVHSDMKIIITVLTLGLSGVFPQGTNHLSASAGGTLESYSSQHGSFPASRLNDDNTSNSWMTSWGVSGSQYFIYSFQNEEARVLSQFRLFNPSNTRAIKHFRLLYSNDSAAKTDPNHSSWSLISGSTETALANLLHQFLGATLEDFRSQHGSFPASRLNDGAHGNVWLSSWGDLGGHYFIFSLPGENAYALNRVDFYNPGNSRGVKDFVVYTSSDAAAKTDPDHSSWSAVTPGWTNGDPADLVHRSIGGVLEDYRSQHGSFPAWRLHDGAHGDTWRSSWGDLGGHYFIFSLPGENAYALNRVDFYNPGNSQGVKYARLLTSSDAAAKTDPQHPSWTAVSGITNTDKADLIISQLGGTLEYNDGGANSSYPASRINDGITSSAYLSSWGNNSNITLIFSLLNETAYSIDKMFLYNVNNSRALKSFRIFYSNSASAKNDPNDPSWVEIGSGFTASQSSSRQEFSFSAVTATYVKILMVDNYGASDYLSLNEIGFEGSADYGSFGVVKLVQNAGQQTVNFNQTTNKYVLVQILTNYGANDYVSLNEIEVYGTADKDDFGIGTLQQAAGQQTFNFSSVTDKYVMVKVLSNYGANDYVSLNEIEVYGTADKDDFGIGTLQQAAGQQTFSFNPVTDKYVMVKVLSNHGATDYLSLSEIEVYGTSQNADFGIFTGQNLSGAQSFSLSPVSGKYLLIQALDNWGANDYMSANEFEIYGQSLTTTMTYTGFPRSKWVLFGVPLQPDDPDPLAVVGDDFDGQPATGINWEVARWDVTDEQYDLYSNNPTGFPQFEPGLGFWIAQDVVASADIDVTGTPVTVGQNDTVDVVPPPSAGVPGKNMLANPFIRSMDWSDTKVTDGTDTKTILEAATAGWVSAYAYIWDYQNEQYQIVAPDEASGGDTIRVWEGFWINQLDHTKTLKVIFPYPSAPKLALQEHAFVDYSSHDLSEYRGGPSQEGLEWVMDLQLVTEDGAYRDVNNWIGISATADDGRDGLDADFFTPNTDHFGALYFIHEDWTPVTRLDYDYRNTGGQEQIWEFEVWDYQVGGQWNLRWPNLSNLPGNMQLSLSGENESDVLIADLRNTSEYSFSLSAGEKRRFKLKAVIVDDPIAPSISTGFVQNPVVKDFVDLYVFPSELLENLTVLLNDEMQSTESHPGVYNIYRTSFKAETTGIHVIVFTMIDLAGNSKVDTLYAVFQNLRTASRVISPDGLVDLVFVSPTTNQPEGIIGIGSGLNTSYHVFPGTLVGNVYTVLLPNESSGPVAEISFRLPPEIIARIDQVPVVPYQERLEGWQPLPFKLDLSKAQLNATLKGSGRIALFKPAGGTPVGGLVPYQTELLFSYPNPFNAVTVIPYSLSQEEHVRLAIYDLLGREIISLRDEFQDAGRYQVTWNGRDHAGVPAPAGVYLVRFQAGTVNQSRKIILLK